MEDLEIALILLEELENQHTHTRVPKGFGVGHPHFGKKLPKTSLGSRPYDDEEVDDEEEKTDKPVKVQISKAFIK